MSAHHETVEDLKALVQTRPHIGKLLEKAITEAALPDIATLDAYYDFLDGMVRWAPKDGPYPKKANKYYWVLDQPSAKKLQNDHVVFRRWMVSFANAWGSYLNTQASAAHIQSFMEDPSFDISQYQTDPGGWKSFNQFFARHLRPGERPIAAPDDPTIIVSPADFTYKSHDRIDASSKIHVKGVTHAIPDLLADSAYANAFAGGTFLHGFLDVNNYHRYHVPLGGKVLETKHIYGEVQLDLKKGPEGEIHAVDGTGWQFTQMRGLIVLDTEAFGKVAAIPVGMAFVSSVNLTPREGVHLRKGEEFGYFMFGGSDLILLFQHDAKLHIDVGPDTFVPMGQKLAHQG